MLQNAEERIGDGCAVICDWRVRCSPQQRGSALDRNLVGALVGLGGVRPASRSSETARRHPQTGLMHDLNTQFFRGHFQASSKPFLDLLSLVVPPSQ
jgi:hypothetical protein